MVEGDPGSGTGGGELVDLGNGQHVRAGHVVAVRAFPGDLDPPRVVVETDGALERIVFCCRDMAHAAAEADRLAGLVRAAEGREKVSEEMTEEG